MTAWLLRNEAARSTWTEASKQSAHVCCETHCLWVLSFSRALSALHASTGREGREGTEECLVPAAFGLEGVDNAKTKRVRARWQKSARLDHVLEHIPPAPCSIVTIFFFGVLMPFYHPSSPLLPCPPPAIGGFKRYLPIHLAIYLCGLPSSHSPTLLRTCLTACRSIHLLAYCSSCLRTFAVSCCLSVANLWMDAGRYVRVTGPLRAGHGCGGIGARLASEIRQASRMTQTQEQKHARARTYEIA
eukprot:6194883-Pleurochrysis_carterae.AAC.1